MQQSKEDKTRQTKQDKYPTNNNENVDIKQCEETKQDRKKARNAWDTSTNTIIKARKRDDASRMTTIATKTTIMQRHRFAMRI